MRAAPPGPAMPDDESAAPPADPVEAVEDAAHAAAESVEAVAEGLSEAADDAAGGLPADTVDALNSRVGDMEQSLTVLREQIARLPGMQELDDAAGELQEAESDVAEAAEQPVHVTVEKAAEVAPRRSFWPKGWPRWL